MTCCLIQAGERCLYGCWLLLSWKEHSTAWKTGGTGWRAKPTLLPFGGHVSTSVKVRLCSILSFFFQAICLKVLHLDWNEVVRCTDILRLQLMITDTCNWSQILDHCNFCVYYCPPAPSWPAHQSRWPQILSTSPRGSCILFLSVQAKWLAVWPRCMQKRFTSTPSSQL